MIKNIYSNLTIVLKIRDNFSMANRWLENSISQSNKFKILIADGSKKKFKISNRFHKLLNIEYIKSPYDKDHLTYMRKLEFVIGKKVKTPYTLIADDDDFYIIARIEEYMRFLLQNKDYVGCGGNILKFELIKNNSNKALFTNFRKSRQTNLSQKNKIQRISLALDKNLYSEVYYDILKTKILSKSITDFIKLNNKNVNYRFVEFYIMVNCLANGKLKRFDNYYLMRQEDYQSSTSAGIINNTTSLFADNWSLNYLNLINYTISKFSLNKNKKIKKNILNMYENLFMYLISTEIINSGLYNISFKSMFKTKINKFFLYSTIVRLKKSISIYWTNLYFSKTLKLYKDIIGNNHN